MISAEAIEIAAKRRCLLREVALRERTYPKLVASGRMKAEAARWELEVMREILADYERKGEDR